jgi:probable phosphoglycerate mutase
VNLLLIRHGEPVRIVDADGPADPPLGDRGRVQSDRLAAWLAQEHIDAVVSSPMRRARQTAAPLAAAHGVQIQIHDGLAEFDVKATSYIPLEELKATGDERYLAMKEGRLDSYGIDLAEFQAAAVSAVEQVIAAHPSRKVAVCCHGGVINAYTSHVIGLDRVLWFETGYTSISRVAASSQAAGSRSIISLNETPHLREVSRSWPAPRTRRRD